MNTYWEGTGKYQDLYNKLHTLIPNSGSVTDVIKNPSLERLRIAGNCYYDLFNNGLANRAVEFRKVFGFGGKWIVRAKFPDHEPLERKLDEFILTAAIEQGLIKVVVA
jgi:hypothetical protein